MRRTRESRRAQLGGLAGSLGLHLAVLLALFFGWQRPAPVEHPPIPVRIIFEAPPKPKPPPRRAEKPPPRGPIASESFGDTNPRDLGPVNSDGLTPGGALLPLDEPNPASILPKPSLIPLTPLPVQTVDVPRPSQKLRPMRRPPHPGRMTMRLAKYPGTAATKDEYLAYITALARQHFDLLPLSLVGHRRGVTEIDIIERSDGTIARMTVLKSSGYPDIDKRVEAIIAAVGRFPPIPQWYQKDRWDLTFILPFPEGLRE